MKSGEVTIKDLARELGISPSTVSRALSGHPDISDATIKKVTELAEKYHYQPNSIALSLRSSKTKTIGVILPEIAHSFFAAIISGIEDAATEKGYNVMLCHTDEIYHREVVDAKLLFSHRVDGLLVGVSKTTFNMDHFKPYIDRGLPLIFFDREPEGIDASTVLVDDRVGAFKAVEHLIEQGCRQILHMAGPYDVSTSKKRLKGYQEALTANGLPQDPDLVVYCESGIDIEEAENTMSQLLAQGMRFDGLFANNDALAIGAIRALKKAGVEIPRQVAVIGFSDWQIASLIEPPLSSVIQPGYKMGQKAVELFFQVQANPGMPPKRIVLNTETVLRESSIRHPNS
jgi:LacI family transcriptional regulator